MKKYGEEYFEEKMADFRAFRDGMIDAGYAEYVANRETAIMLYSMWRR